MRILISKIDELVRVVKQYYLLNKKTLTLKEAAEYMQVSESQMYKLTHNRRIPHSKPTGKLVFFNKSDLDEFCLSNRIKSEQEIQDLADMYHK